VSLVNIIGLESATLCSLVLSENNSSPCIKYEILHQQGHNIWKEDNKLKKGAYTFTGLVSGWAGCESLSFSVASCGMKNSDGSSEQKINKQHKNGHRCIFTHYICLN
jgi:hypothetical protein